MKVIHIGFPKTASTYLQKSAFPQLPKELNYVYSNKTNDLFFKICNEDDTIFDQQLAKSRLEDFCDNSKINLFSWEPLTGLHYKTGFVNRSLIARRLKALGFDKVVIIIRNQYDILESTYKEYIKHGGVLKFRHYFNHLENDKRYYIHLGYYDFLKTVELYINLFKRENVCVLQYEDLERDFLLPSLYLFLGLTGVPPQIGKKFNRSLSKRGTNILRIINHFTFSRQRPSQLISRKISTRLFYRLLAKLFIDEHEGLRFLNAKHQELVFQYYKKSNQKLKSEYNLDLDSAYPQ